MLVLGIGYWSPCNACSIWAGQIQLSVSDEVLQTVVFLFELGFMLGAHHNMSRWDWITWPYRYDMLTNLLNILNRVVKILEVDQIFSTSKDIQVGPGG